MQSKFITNTKKELYDPTDEYFDELTFLAAFDLVTIFDERFATGKYGEVARTEAMQLFLQEKGLGVIGGEKE